MKHYAHKAKHAEELEILQKGMYQRKKLLSCININCLGFTIFVDYDVITYDNVVSNVSSFIIVSGKIPCGAKAVAVIFWLICGNLLFEDVLGMIPTKCKVNTYLIL